MNNSILFERRGQIATVTLNRPERLNAINLQMWSQLRELVQGLDADESIRVVIVRSAVDGIFSAGGDIHEFETERNNSTQARSFAARLEGALDAVAALGKPTISLIRGYCVGGGLELATATDLRIAGDDAVFGLPIAKLGVLIGNKEMRRLAALVGPGVAMDLLLTARLMDAAQALRVGLVSQVVPAAQVEAFTYDLAERMCALAPLSARWHKQILQTVLNNPDLNGLTPAGQVLPFACYDTQDFYEGRSAFIAKRMPTFRGL